MAAYYNVMTKAHHSLLVTALAAIGLFTLSFLIVFNVLPH